MAEKTYTVNVQGKQRKFVRRNGNFYEVRNGKVASSPSTAKLVLAMLANKMGEGPIKLKPRGPDPKKLANPAPKKKKPKPSTTSALGTASVNAGRKTAAKKQAKTSPDRKVRKVDMGFVESRTPKYNVYKESFDSAKPKAPAKKAAAKKAAPKKSGLPSDVLRKFQGTYNQKTEALRNIVVNGKKSTYVVKKKKK